jgi:hypothetical protein
VMEVQMEAYVEVCKKMNNVTDRQA